MRSKIYGLLLLLLAVLLAACGSGSATGGSGASAATATTPTVGPTSTMTTSPVTPAVVKATVPLTKIRMLDQSNGWALTKSQILVTADGGLHWKDVTPANASFNITTNAQFMSQQYAWIATAQPNADVVVVLRTIDGGQRWSSVSLRLPGPTNLDQPHFMNINEGWLEVITNGGPGAGSESADILHSSNGGQSWSRVASTDTPNSGLTREGYKSGISFKDTMTGWATTSSDTGNPMNPGLFVTHDGGKIWQRQSLPLPAGIDGIGTTPPVLFGNDGVLPTQILTHGGQLELLLYVTHDGGNSWSPTNPVIVSSSTTYVVDPLHIWTTDVQTGQFFYTSDGGQKWQKVANNHGRVLQLSFIDSTNGWAITDNALLHMQNGGPWNSINYTIQ